MFYVEKKKTGRKVSYLIKCNGGDDGSEPFTLAECWDLHLAEALKDAIRVYMGG